MRDSEQAGAQHSPLDRQGPLHRVELMMRHGRGRQLWKGAAETRHPHSPQDRSRQRFSAHGDVLGGESGHHSFFNSIAAHRKPGSAKVFRFLVPDHLPSLPVLLLNLHLVVERLFVVKLVFFSYRSY